MEWIAAKYSRYPKRIFALSNYVQIVRNGKMDFAEENLGRNPTDGSLFRSATWLFAQGTLTVRATDFPRVHRRITAECIGTPPTCAIPESSSPKAQLRLRSGTASFSFMQTSADRLNMRLSLISGTNVVLDSIDIEP
jgi:hypothetical protein